MRIFATKWFVRFARKQNLRAEMLRDAIARAERGSVDAQLGAGLIKQRVARPGKGRSGGYRTLIAFQSKNRSVFLYGFAKNERDNIDEIELADLIKLARRFLTMSDAEIEHAVAHGELMEVADAIEDQS